MSRPPSAVLVVVAALLLAGCTEVESESPTGYEPSKLEPVKGDDDLQRVTFTAEGARRIGLRTARGAAERDSTSRSPTQRSSTTPEGKTFVYTSPSPLEYLAPRVEVARIDGRRVRSRTVRPSAPRS